MSATNGQGEASLLVKCVSNNPVPRATSITGKGLARLRRETEYTVTSNDTGRHTPPILADNGTGQEVLRGRREGEVGSWSGARTRERNFGVLDSKGN